MLNRLEIDWNNEYSQPFMFEGGRHAVLLLHGFTGSPAHMRPMGEALNKKGYTVQAIMLPGHGTRLEDMRQCTGQTYIEAVRRAVFSLKEKHDKVSVAGLSMGGVLSLILAEQMEIHSVITISAPMHTQNRLMPLAKVASPFKPVTYWREDQKRQTLLNPDYDYGYSGFPTRAAYELYKLIALARRNLFAIHCPLLAIQSHADKTISKNSLHIIINGIASTKKASLWLNMAPHVMTISNDLNRIVEAADVFLKES